MFNLVSAIALFCSMNTHIVDCDKVIKECANRQIWSYIEIFEYEPQMDKEAYYMCTREHTALYRKASEIATTFLKAPVHVDQESDDSFSLLRD